MVQAVQHILFDGQILEFEKKLSQHFYNHSKKILVLHNIFADWLTNHFRRQEEIDSSLIFPYYRT